MADLLECLLQIKGLRGTVDRVAPLAACMAGDGGEVPAGAGPTARELMACMAELEVIHGAAVRLILGSTRPTLPAVDEAAVLAMGQRARCSAAEAFDRFTARRRHTLELLDGCSADDLHRVGVHPVRREMTLADLVAVMLALDTDHVGEIRRRLKPTEQ